MVFVKLLFALISRYRDVPVYNPQHRIETFSVAGLGAATVTGGKKKKKMMVFTERKIRSYCTFDFFSQIFISYILEARKTCRDPSIVLRKMFVRKQ